MIEPYKLQFGIYHTGRVVVLGAPSYEYLENGANVLLAELPKYRLGQEYRSMHSDNHRTRE